MDFCLQIFNVWQNCFFNSKIMSNIAYRNFEVRSHKKTVKYFLKRKTRKMLLDIWTTIWKSVMNVLHKYCYFEDFLGAWISLQARNWNFIFLLDMKGFLAKFWNKWPYLLRGRHFLFWCQVWRHHKDILLFAFHKFWWFKKKKKKKKKKKRKKKKKKERKDLMATFYF